MAIEASVGQEGVNAPSDVRVIQAALNAVMHPEIPLAVDGLIGPKTIGMITSFQDDKVGLRRPDGRVDPGGRTLRTLHSLIPKALTPDALAAVMPSASSRVVEKYFPLLNHQCDCHSAISSPLRLSHFLAQIGHESLSLQLTEELASGEAYEGRDDLGNTQPGDGVRFKGRGLIQLTGRYNYERYAVFADLDTSDEHWPEQLCSPEHALAVSLWFWEQRGLADKADKDDVKGITKAINGGYNGLADREAYLARAKFFLT
ncbi:MAG: chitinase [Thalassolituus sp.]|nr:MAG: chitinase [Thalassolituus sp.]